MAWLIAIDMRADHCGDASSGFRRAGFPEETVLDAVVVAGEARNRLAQPYDWRCAEDRQSLSGSCHRDIEMFVIADSVGVGNDGMVVLKPFD